MNRTYYSGCERLSELLCRHLQTVHNRFQPSQLVLTAIPAPRPHSPSLTGTPACGFFFPTAAAATPNSSSFLLKDAASSDAILLSVVCTRQEAITVG